MALPDAWLDHLFGKMLVRYGDAWLRKWDSIPIAEVRADWGRVLDGMTGNDIAYGLQYMSPEFPPTATAFLAVCKQRHRWGDASPVCERLPAPPTTVNHEAVARLRSMVAGIGRPPKAKERAPLAGYVPPEIERPLVGQGPLPWPHGVPR